MSDETTDPTDCTARIVSIHATSWRIKEKPAAEEEIPKWLSSLARTYEQNRVQLPRAVPASALNGNLDNPAITLVPESDGVTIAKSEVKLFTLPSNQVVLEVTLWLRGGALNNPTVAAPIAAVLERCVDGAFTINGKPAEQAITEVLDNRLFERDRLDDKPQPSLLPDQHQLVFALGHVAPREDVWETIIYREKPPSRPEFVLRLRRPEQLNKNGDVGVVTPYTSLFYDQADYVEASVLLSTIHAVGTAARFRYIWRQAYDQVLRFRDQKQRAISGLQTRDDLEELADNLGNLEFDLTFSVEFPLMRVETFQSELYDAMDLDRQARTLSQMFDQIGGSLRSEITAIEVREQRETEARQRWNSVAAGVLSLFGVAVGFVIAYLGINTVEVPDHELSMWDGTFKHMYLTAASFAVIPVYLILFPYLKNYTKRRGRHRPTFGITNAVGGGLVFAGSVVADVKLTDSKAIFAAIGMALGFFFLVVGATLIGMWFWWQRRLNAHERKLAAAGDAAPTPPIPHQRPPSDAPSTTTPDVPAPSR
jgi:hypothetical protein